MNLEKWYELKEKTADLSFRERSILAMVMVVAVAFIWLETIYSNIETAQKHVNATKSELMRQSVTQTDRLSELTTLLAHDPNEPLRQQQIELNAQLVSLRENIESRLSHLIAPEKMADVMQTVLSDYKGLKLISARNLPVEPLLINDKHEKKQNNKQPEPQQAVIFAHGFEMMLSGNYFQTLEFLQRLEQMNGFYWQKLDYQVEKYPNAKITLQLNTLSLEEDWIGV